MKPKLVTQKEISYWETQALKGPWDFLIVGAGVTGLHAAIEIKIQYPRTKVLVLEARSLGAVASTRNAGFLCLGSPTELLADRKNLGETALVELLSAKWAGIQRNLHLLGSKSMGLRNVVGYEIFAFDHSRFAQAAPHEHEMPSSDLALLNEMMVQGSNAPIPFVSKRRKKGHTRFNELPRPYFGDWKPFCPSGSQEASHWGPAAAGYVSMAWEGQVHPFLLREALMRYARNLGIRIQEGMHVPRVLESRVDTNEPLDLEIGAMDKVASNDDFSIMVIDNQLEINSKNIIYATNALSNSFLPSGKPEVTPQRGQMWVSAPLKPHDLTRLNGNYHADRGYLYYRTHEGRLLLGGGRNQDFDSEQTAEWSENHKISDYLKSYAVEVLGLSNSLSWETRWSGTMGFTGTGLPHCLQLPSGAWLVAGMNGMGMALGPEMGRRVACMALQSR
jgi:glycine/D-amino acid oxidase-like deaminating enzyme